MPLDISGRKKHMLEEQQQKDLLDRHRKSAPPLTACLMRGTGRRRYRRGTGTL